MDSKKSVHAGPATRSGMRAGTCNGEPLENNLDEFVASFRHWAIGTCDRASPQCKEYLELYLDKFRTAVLKSWGI